MSLRLILGLFLFNSMMLFSQENTIKHTIGKGETILSIANKYEVKPSAIYKLNPNAKKKLLKLNSVLLIPNTTPKIAEIVPEIAPDYIEKEHEVVAKETISTIAKKYGITILELRKANPGLGKVLKPGRKIKLPKNATSTEMDVTSQTKKDSLRKQATESEAPSLLSEEIRRKVLPKESKYSISRKYGITVKEFNKLNPKLGSKYLKVGQEIRIPVNALSLAEIAGVSPSTTEELVAKVDPESAVSSESIVSTEKVDYESEYFACINEINNSLYSVADSISVEKNGIERIGIERVGLDFSGLSNQLIDTASMNIGTRYRSGGTTKGGFDCSGLMLATFAAFEIKLPRSSIEQSSYGEKINSEEAQKGDLIFFKTNGRRRINHVGMVVEVCEGEIKFIHSSIRRGVIISSTKENYYKKSFAQVNRVL
jgi:cell wall-associated NlpC family hydrolase